MSINEFMCFYLHIMKETNGDKLKAKSYLNSFYGTKSNYDSKPKLKLSSVYGTMKANHSDRKE